MGIILICVVAFIVFVIAIFSVVQMATNRVTAPTDDLKEEIKNLKHRVTELENKKK